MTYSDESHESHGHHIISQTKLMMTFAALLFFMVATVLAAYFMPESIKQNSLLMNMIAIGIATIKAYLVIQIFMGVKFASKLTKLFAWGGFAWFFMLFLMFADYLSRPLEPVPGWEPGGASALPRTTTAQPD